MGVCLLLCDEFMFLDVQFLQIKIAEWNPEKDLLAMVTEDSKILLHRFNWQRLWTISPGENTSALNYVLQLKVYSVKQDY